LTPPPSFPDPAGFPGHHRRLLGSLGSPPPVPPPAPVLSSSSFPSVLMPLMPVGCPLAASAAAPRCRGLAPVPDPSGPLFPWHTPRSLAVRMRSISRPGRAPQMPYAPRRRRRGLRSHRDAPPSHTDPPTPRPPHPHPHTGAISGPGGRPLPLWSSPPPRPVTPPRGRGAVAVVPAMPR
jgi:hypothetical protein